MIDLNLLKNIMEEVRENDDLLDSLSPMQFKSKLNLRTRNQPVAPASPKFRQQQ